MLLAEVNSLPNMQRDLIVVNSRDLGNKSFEQLQFEKLRRILKRVKDQNELEIRALTRKEDRFLGKKDSTVDCITWNVIDRISEESTYYDISKIDVKSKLQTNISNNNIQSMKHLNRTSQSLYSVNLIATLHTVVSKVKINLQLNTVNILEIFCGELTWTKEFLKIRNDVRYTGIDTDEQIIRRNNLKYKTALPHSKFFVFDAIDKMVWEKFDIVLMFNVIPWLTKEHILNLLYNISSSGSTFLLIGDDMQAQKLATKYQLASLLDQPFDLQPPVCVRRINHVKSVMLWSLPMKQRNVL